MSEYDFEDDFRKSIELCYEVIRARAKSGGPWWRPKMKYTFSGRVLAVEEHKVSRYVSGIGKEATFEDVPSGWRVSIAIGDSRLGLIFPAGDKPVFEGLVKITIENQPPEETK